MCIYDGIILLFSVAAPRLNTCVCFRKRKADVNIRTKYMRCAYSRRLFSWWITGYQCEPLHTECTARTYIYMLSWNSTGLQRCKDGDSVTVNRLTECSFYEGMHVHLRPLCASDSFVNFKLLIFPFDLIYWRQCDFNYHLTAFTRKSQIHLFDKIFYEQKVQTEIGDAPCTNTRSECLSLRMKAVFRNW